MVLRSQMHREMGIGSGDYLLIAQSVGAIHRNSKSYFADVCKQLGLQASAQGVAQTLTLMLTGLGSSPSEGPTRTPQVKDAGPHRYGLPGLMRLHL